MTGLQNGEEPNASPMQTGCAWIQALRKPGDKTEQRGRTALALVQPSHL
ncbi:MULTISPECIES: hypothetical protein [Paraburkholderia]|nr:MULTISPECIES: hypothetical protein [Paraburkholderia]MCX4156126.1 hypothetical protein [Paraburkholderia aspalathi]MDN7165532.1 hypothetical protein [Paraburkholderia sp. SECH2]MDQ6394018.1 hypothetical protein [Paraburkholderia aspalathi]